LVDTFSLIPEDIPTTKQKPTRTIRLSEEDEQEIDRIDSFLRERGLKPTPAAQIVRLALRVAFRETHEEDLRAYHRELQAKYARGKKPS
jgi:hypothetical protein